MITRIFLLTFVSSFCLSASQQQTDTINQTDASGKKQGYWEKLYPNGKPIYKGYFKNDKPVGTMTRYYESGAIKAVIDFFDSENYSKTTFFYEDSSKAAEGFYIGNKKDSTWDFYSFYFKVLKSTENYKNGLKHGKSYVYYTTGNIFDETNWTKGKKNGEWIQYFQNGNIKMKAYYKNEKLNGEFNVFFENGEHEIKGKYVNNLRDGKWIFFNNKGEILLEVDYDMGQALNQEVLDEQQKEFFRKMDENIGKIREPEPEDFVGH